MNKQELIEQAYGEHWQYYKDNVDEDGWIRDRDFWDKWREDKNSLIKIEWETTDNDNDYLDKRRPISLKGIENNNGWIKIESEEDLPKEGVTKYLTSSNNKVSDYPCNLFELFWLCKNGHITHYQPIVKPQPPLY